MRHIKQIQAGFTLVEMIIVMVITGIVGGMVAIFLKAPIQQYVDVARRAELTDVADMAFHRLLRDIRTSVPNSVRMPAPAGSSYIEFLPTRTGGRYRANQGAGTLCGVATPANAGDALSFTGADGCFEIIGPQLAFAASDAIVVGSTQSDGNQPYCNQSTCAATSGVLRAYTGGVGAQSTVSIATVTPEFPPSAELPSQRFQVVDGAQQAVTYACVGTLGALNGAGDGQAKLMRYWNYGFQPTQVAPPATVGGATGIGALAHSEAVLADNVSACNFVYDIANQRNALVAVSLQITQGNETVSLYEEVHVNNAP